MNTLVDNVTYEEIVDKWIKRKNIPNIIMYVFLGVVLCAPAYLSRNEKMIFIIMMSIIPGVHFLCFPWFIHLTMPKSQIARYKEPVYDDLLAFETSGMKVPFFVYLSPEKDHYEISGRKRNIMNFEEGELILDDTLDENDDLVCSDLSRTTFEFYRKKNGHLKTKVKITSETIDITVTLFKELVPPFYDYIRNQGISYKEVTS